MSTETRPDVDLEELLDSDIPCQGFSLSPAECDRPASFRSFSHAGVCSISRTPPPWFKCMSCWQAWYLYVTKWIAANGPIRCRCGGTFHTAESYSDYRPF